MNYRDLFPDCTKRGCTQHPGERKHVLPHQIETIESDAKYLAAVGGYGSGKTLGFVILGHLLSVSVPGNIGLVGRRTLPKLHDNTQRIYMEILQRSGVQWEGREVRDGWAHRVIYPNQSEVHFRPTTDLGRFLGPEYGWFLLDEAQEEPRSSMTRLMGRLRLPRAAKYLKGMLSTNPPHKQHWLAQMFPKPGKWTASEKVELGGAELLVSTNWQMIRTQTADNPFLDPSYIADLQRVHTPEELKRILSGLYGFEQKGRPAFGKFEYTKHVGELSAQLVTLFRSWDFGFRQPVVLWGQIARCKKAGLHCNFLHEYVPQEITSETLADNVLAETARKFPNFPKQYIVDCGDEAGAQHSEKGPGPIIRLSQAPYNIKFRYRRIRDIEPGLELARRLLGTKCACGFPLLMVDRSCSELIDAMAGGYHLPDESKLIGRNVSSTMNKPVKDGYYDNLGDAARYALENFYRVAAIDPEFMRQLTTTETGPMIETPDGWTWMEGIRG